MTLQSAVSLGVAGNELSKTITGTSEVSVGRSAVATTAGAAGGAIATGGLVVAGFVSAPVVVPLAVASGAVAFVCSLWD